MTEIEYQAEIARLQAIINGMAERIAAASEVIGARAERDALRLLEEWRSVEEGREPLINGSCVALITTSEYKSVAAYRQPKHMPSGHLKSFVCVGTDAEPATLSACILAALALWERLYGKDGAA